MRISDWSSDVCSSDLSSPLRRRLITTSLSKPGRTIPRASKNEGTTIMTKVIISCAITGSIHTPSMSPHLPVTAAEIAESALGAAEAGAAIVHLHARNPEDGRPDQSPEAFEPFLRTIKQSSDVEIGRASCRERVCQYV